MTISNIRILRFLFVHICYEASVFGVPTLLFGADASVFIAMRSKMVYSPGLRVAFMILLSG